MHLLAATPGAPADDEAVDLGQSPGDVVVLSAADTELALLAAAQAGRPGGEETPSLRLASLLQLRHNLSVDLYLDRVVRHARLVVARLLGGRAYWPYGVDRLAALCRAEGIALALLPGDDQPDPELTARGTVAPETAERLWRFLAEGGAANADGFLAEAAALIGRPVPRAEPAALPRSGLYWPGLATPTLDDVRARWAGGRPVAALLFYRALVQSGSTAPVDAIIAALDASGLDALPVFVHSLRRREARARFAALAEAVRPRLTLAFTGFSIGALDAPETEPLAGIDGPVLQVVLAGTREADWRAGTSGLAARDVAMQVALPEVDGRLLTRAIAFKSEARFDPATECAVVTWRPVPDRVDHVARLAAAWARLAETPPAERRIALVLANYPNRDGRLANGVGLDTPASTVAVLDALAGAGYRVENAPPDAAALMARLRAGPTNAAGSRRRAGGVDLPLDAYRRFLDALAPEARQRVTDRWGAPEADPGVAGDRFRLPVMRLGSVAVAIQPARGYQIDPAASYHDPDLVPPHGYLAFHAWLRESFDAHAVVFVGKHGNLEWLPGKALALSADCFPEAALGAVPVLYPFIVNDPGEGSQAKRRLGAAVVDHLTPPLTRAGSHGPFARLETLVDEYAEAARLDRRRLRPIGEEILDLCRVTGLDRDLGLHDLAEDAALGRLDAYLCELKDRQIRGGLHVLGTSPADDARAEMLVALTRVPRGDGPGDASLIRALADDLGLGLDPLAAEPADRWAGPRPAALAGLDAEPWRTHGDTVDRLEALALATIRGDRAADPSWERTAAVLDAVDARLAPALDSCGSREIAHLLAGLDGRFVPPGPAGAPTRGRPEVLPTGRNFYSVDTRAVPTAAAWRLGWEAAQAIVATYAQENGEWPRTIALSAWGTSNMRTGGDDVAQALALIGARPTWDATGRVTGYEVLPVAVLDRPRVDVTLRVSGFFRDAFPAQMALFDAAVRQIAALDEAEADNPIAATVRRETDRLAADGAPDAARRAAHRVFGARPGAYGAGLQALVDEGGWTGDADFAEAFLAWGGWAYAGGEEGEAAGDALARRLGETVLVLHNQDNHEHDILDSDDYYQFMGGLAATVRHLSGRQPAIFLGDHSRPERPRVRSLADEIGRVVRARATNPKWIDGMMRHGYKGAFEIAATVDYLFAFAASARVVEDHHFDALYDAYVGDPRVVRFMREANPDALGEMAARFDEAIRRGLWRPRSNSAPSTLAALTETAT